MVISMLGMLSITNEVAFHLNQYPMLFGKDILFPAHSTIVSSCMTTVTVCFPILVVWLKAASFLYFICFMLSYLVFIFPCTSSLDRIFKRGHFYHPAIISHFEAAY